MTTLAARPQNKKVEFALSETNSDITIDQLRRLMPKKQSHHITPHLVDTLNEMVDEPEVRNAFRENILGYTKVLTEPNAQLPNYIFAVKYVSYKLLGFNNIESWIKTFPERYQRLLDKQKHIDFIRSIVAGYNRGKMVQQIFEQTMVPTYVLNQDMYQKALSVQCELMLTARSEKVRSDAANSLLTHLKQPEATKINIDVNVQEDDSIRELKQSTLELIKQQRLMIQSGAMNAQEIAEGTLITGEFERVEN